MEYIEGRIEGKAEATAKTGAKFWTFTISGKKYNTFDENLSKFEIGTLVKIGLEQKGQFKNLVSMESITETPGKVSQDGSEAVSEAIKGIIVNKTERPNSYEFGKVGNRFKLYFEDVDELKSKINELKLAGLYVDEVSDGQ